MDQFDFSRIRCISLLYMWCWVALQESHFFFEQDLENQALAEAETWREQQAHLQEQQASQNRAKQEAEAEVERFKQVSGTKNVLKHSRLI